MFLSVFFFYFGCFFNLFLVLRRKKVATFWHHLVFADVLFLIKVCREIGIEKYLY